MSRTCAPSSTPPPSRSDSPLAHQRRHSTKHYSTGGLYADWFGGTAVDEDDRVVLITVPIDREGVEVLDGFDATGRRLTACGSTPLTDIHVTATL
ncbi:hypothetical protein [Streptomyces sp. NPDC021212]|uniref:hypothetical protein n=1 Tax=Streptomyces sp. NPDC021212 TaxID=3365118 RepID=UPI0037A9BA88